MIVIQTSCYPYETHGQLVSSDVHRQLLVSLSKVFGGLRIATTIAQ